MVEGDKILKHKNKVAVFDILANTGGVVISCFEFEWVQNVQSLMWNEEEIRSKPNIGKSL